MKRCVIAAVVASLLSVVAARAGELVLVEKGVSRAPIIVFQGAPPYTRLAADDLARYIEKTSGARPPVIEGQPQPVPEHAIWVGFQPKLKELFPEIDFDFKHPEEILIAANEKHLVIAGRDRWDPAHLAVQGRRKKVEGVQQEYGTTNAVYTFLQDHLGVRWLWPGEHGEDVAGQATVAFAPFQYRYHPQIRSRNGIFHFSSLLADSGYGISRDWTRVQRLQLDSLSACGGHAFTTWWERFHETHPEYFALQPDGTRQPVSDGRSVKLCESNPAVARQWLAGVQQQLEENPNQTVFNASPNDGWITGHCMCEHCRAWDHPDGEPRRFGWKGLSKEYVALSDRDVTFANRCAGLLKERYPDKDYYVLMMAYGHTRPAPLKAVPTQNVIISSVANCFSIFNAVDRGSTRGTMYRQQLEDWARIAPHLMWRPNTGTPAGWQQGQPDVQMTQIIKTFEFIARNKCIGIFIDGVWEHWATQGPQYYLMAQLAWNPQQDGQAILDDYYRRAFGVAAPEVKAYWSFLEKTREAFVAGDRSYPEVYDEAMFDKAYGILDRASAAVADEPGVYGKRVQFLRVGLDHTRLIIEIRALMEEYQKSKGQAAEIATKVRDRWQKIEQLCKDNPYAINWGPIRPGTPRMQGLSPEHPAKKKKKTKTKGLE